MVFCFQVCWAHETYSNNSDKAKELGRIFFNEMAFELELAGPIERIWSLTDTFV